MARDGIADIASHQSGLRAWPLPDHGIVGTALHLRQFKEGSAALDAWYRKYADREMKDVKYCLTFAHDPATFHTTNKKVTVPGDVKGMKIRPANATIARYISLLGGANVQASAPESRDLLEKGVAEGITFPWGSIDPVRHRQGDEVSPRLAALRHRTGLRAEQGEIRLAVAGAAQGDRRSLHTGMGAEDRNAVGRHGVERPRQDQGAAEPGGLSADAEQLAAWRKAAEPLKTEWETQVKKAGYDPAAIYKELQDELKKRNAAY